MMDACFKFGLIASLAWCGIAAAAEQGKPHDMSKMWQSSLARPQLSTSAVFDERGTLWLAQVQDGHVLPDRRGRTGAQRSLAVVRDVQAVQLAQPQIPESWR